MSEVLVKPLFISLYIFFFSGGAAAPTMPEAHPVISGYDSAVAGERINFPDDNLSRTRPPAK